MNPTSVQPLAPAASPLRGRNEALALALDATLTSIWDYDVPGSTVTLDANWSRMLGGPAKESSCSIRSLFALLHPDDRLRASQATFACLSGKTEEYSHEYRVKDHHGHWIWVQSRGRVMRRDSDGRALRLIGTNIDVSERKTCELAAGRQLDFLQALNQTTLALLQQRAKSEILESLAGYAAALLESASVEVALVEGDELVTHAYGGTIRTPGASRANRTEAVLSWRAVDSRQVVIVDDFDRLPDVAAPYREVNFRNVAIFPILLGSRCLGVIAFLRDVAGSRFSREEMEKGVSLAQLAALVIHNATIYEDAVRVADNRTVALRESEALFKGVFHGSPIPIILLTMPEGRIRAINPACEEVFGYRPDEAIGLTTLELNVWPDVSRRQALLDELRTGRMIRPIEVEFRRKDGRIFTAIYSVAQLIIADEPCMLASVIDITAQKQAEAALRKSESQLRQAQKMESLGTLAGGIAHDFNNILTGILGYTQLALTDLDPAHPAAQWMEGILKSGDRARNLVHQILTFSRKTESARSPVRLQLIARESLDLLRSTLPAMVRIESDLDPTCPPALVDPTEMHQVILNLCTNAWQALPEKGGLITLTLAPKELTPAFTADHPPLRAGPHLHLSVRDNGKGMTAATIERIFEPFFTTKAAGKGTGLGLAVVHSVVTAHGGTVLVQSAPDRGTCFDIYLPALHTVEVPPAPTAIELPRGQGESMLVVDDEQASGTVITRLIEKLGYRVTYCDDPFKAIALLYTNDFAGLVTDLAMPGLPGDELARQALVRRPAFPILLLSGYIEPAKAEQLKAAGVREILNKPPSYEELAVALHRCLRS